MTAARGTALEKSFGMGSSDDRPLETMPDHIEESVEKVPFVQRILSEKKHRERGDGVCQWIAVRRG